MFVPLPLLIAGVAIILLLLILLSRKARRAHDPLLGGKRRPLPPPRDRSAPGPGAPVSVTLSPETDRAVRALIVRDRRIEAIKLVREESGMGLKDSKDFVDRLAGQG